MLARGGEHNVADHVERDVQRLRLVIPQVAHFKPAAQHGAYVKQAAVHRVAAGGHIVNVDISVALRLKLFDRQKEFLIELFVELVENQAAAGGNQRAVGVGILLVADVHDGLRFLIDRVEHLHEIGLIVAVIAIRFGDRRVDGVQRALDDVVHLRNHNAVRAQRFAFLGDEAADEIQLVGLEGIEHTLGAFIDGGDDLLNVKRLLRAVFFDDVHPHTHSSLCMIET